MPFRIRASTALMLGVLAAWPIPSIAQVAVVPPASIRGRVIDAQSRQPVEQAEVTLVGAAPPTFTDASGAFELSGVRAGAYTLSVTHLGYVSQRRPVELAAGATLTLEFALAQNAIRLEEVIVTPGSFSFMSRAGGPRQSMSRADVEAVPQVGSDIFRAVNRLPGLSSNDYAAHFSIRGGRHDETLILLDGLELYEPYHLKDFNEGAISIIDASTIDGVHLMTGGFPARYGNRRSGVFDIRSRTPDAGHTLAEVSASFLNAHALAMGPLGGDRGSWLAFGRTGYMGLVFNFIDQADLPRPHYDDVFAKWTYRLGTRHELSVDLLHAGDRYTYDIAATTGFLDTIRTRERANTRYRNSYVWSTLRSTLGPRTTVTTLVSSGWIDRDREGSERDERRTAAFYAITNERRYTTQSIVQDWTHGFSDRDILTVGADLRAMRNRDQYVSTVYQDPDDPSPEPGEFPLRTRTSLAKSGTRLALHASNRVRVAKPLVFEAGVRYDQASWTGDHDTSPRASIAWDLGRGMNLRLGWGVYRQMQGIDDVAALNGPARYYRSVRSDQWTASWDRIGARGEVLRVETYAKRGSHLRPTYRNWKGSIDAFPEPNEDRILVFPSRNTSQGIEAYFEHPVGRTITARASYAFAKTEEEVARIVNVNSLDTPTFDRIQPGPQDQRHAANLDLTYRAGGYTLNGSFAYHSGWPATLEHLVPVTNENGQPDVAVRPKKLYGARLPDYLRLDMRASRRWDTPLGEFGTFVEVLNLTNHTNVFGYDYFRMRDPSGRTVLERGDETWFSTLPSLGVTWSRKF